MVACLYCILMFGGGFI